MSNQITAIMKAGKRETTRNERVRLRKHLNADALFATMRAGFNKINDHRPGEVQHSLADTLMSGFAMFSLKDPSLLAFDERRFAEPHNLKTIYGTRTIPSDTSMREILDGVSPDCLRPLFKDAFRPLQRGKALEKMVFMEDSYLLNLDGTGYFSSKALYSDGFRYILGVKEGDHKFLFQFVDQAVENGETIELVIGDKKREEISHCFRIVSNAPLNKSNQDRLVTFVEYWELNAKTGKEQHFSWITDLDITEENVYQFMRGARARWKIENETFNTLKNQGYQFGHNFGLGKQHLSEVFVLLMMLAFLVDQIQQLCCPLFQAAWKRWKTKRSLWEKVRSKFHEFHIDTMEELYRSILDHKPVPLPG